MKNVIAWAALLMCAAVSPQAFAAKPAHLAAVYSTSSNSAPDSANIYKTANRKGSTRKGGSNSHGKGSKYVGGRR